MLQDVCEGLSIAQSQHYKYHTNDIQFLHIADLYIGATSKFRVKTLWRCCLSLFAF